MHACARFSCLKSTQCYPQTNPPTRCFMFLFVYSMWQDVLSLRIRFDSINHYLTQRSRQSNKQHNNVLSMTQLYFILFSLTQVVVLWNRTTHSSMNYMYYPVRWISTIMITVVLLCFHLWRVRKSKRPQDTVDMRMTRMQHICTITC